MIHVRRTFMSVGLAALLIVVALVGLAASVGAANMQAPAAPPALAVDPSSQRVTVGQVFTVNVTIADAVNLNGFQFTLQFDPAVVTVTNVASGNFLPSIFPLPAQYTTDSVTYGEFSLGGTGSGNGVLAT